MSSENWQEWKRIASDQSCIACFEEGLYWSGLIEAQNDNDDDVITQVRKSKLKRVEKYYPFGEAPK